MRACMPFSASASAISSSPGLTTIVSAYSRSAASASLTFFIDRYEMFLRAAVDVEDVGVGFRFHCRFSRGMKRRRPQSRAAPSWRLWSFTHWVEAALYLQLCFHLAEQVHGGVETNLIDDLAEVGPRVRQHLLAPVAIGPSLNLSPQRTRGDVEDRAELPLRQVEVLHARRHVGGIGDPLREGPLAVRETAAGHCVRSVPVAVRGGVP